MTTYRRTKAIVEQVLEAGVRNLQLMYTGWSSWDPSFVSALELETRLCSRSDFDSLVSYHATAGSGCPDLAFQTV